MKIQKENQGQFYQLLASYYGDKITQALEQSQYKDSVSGIEDLLDIYENNILSILKFNYKNQDEENLKK